MSECSKCLQEIRARQHVITCDSCDRDHHRTCGTGVTLEAYRESRRTGVSVVYVCTACTTEEDTLLYDDSAPLLTAAESDAYMSPRHDPPVLEISVVPALQPEEETDHDMEISVPALHQENGTWLYDDSAPLLTAAESDAYMLPRHDPPVLEISVVPALQPEVNADHVMEISVSALHQEYDDSAPLLTAAESDAYMSPRHDPPVLEISVVPALQPEVNADHDMEISVPALHQENDTWLYDDSAPLLTAAESDAYMSPRHDPPVLEISVVPALQLEEETDHDMEISAPEQLEEEAKATDNTLEMFDNHIDREIDEPTLSQEFLEETLAEMACAPTLCSTVLFGAEESFSFDVRDQQPDGDLSLSFDLPNRSQVEEVHPIEEDKMNMRTPKHLRERDPIYSSLPQLEDVIDLTEEESEWTAEEIENVERQVEQVLLEEAFIEACFEEMLAEEEAQWHHYLPAGGNVYLDTHTGVYCIFTDNTLTELNYSQTSFSKLNPEAPEFVPRGLAS